jgi:hypothetical protein
MHRRLSSRSRPGSTLGILSSMRFATPVVAVIAAVLIAACGGSVAAPKPDPAGDTAFVTAVTLLCTKTPPLAQIDASASLATLTTAANANDATLTNFEIGTPVPPSPGQSAYAPVRRRGGLGSLTPKIYSASPLAVPVTDLAQMVVDASKWYKMIATPPTPAKLNQLSRSPGGVTAALTKQALADGVTASARITRARADLAKIGVASCLD